jgi:hypothetical protein
MKKAQGISINKNSLAAKQKSLRKIIKFGGEDGSTNYVCRW